MRIIKEIDLEEFEARGKGKDTLKIIKNNNKVEGLDALLTEIYSHGLDENSLNEILESRSEWLFKQLEINHQEGGLSDWTTKIDWMLASCC